MGVQSDFYSVDGQSKTFPSSKHIATKQHMAVWLRQSLDAVDVQLDSSKYELITNAAVLNTAPSVVLYDRIEIRVADSSEELTSSPSAISIVSGINTEIVDVAAMSDKVVDIAEIDAEIVTVAGIAAEVVAVATEPFAGAIVDVATGDYVKWVEYPTVIKGQTAIATIHNLDFASIYINGVLQKIGKDYSTIGNLLTLINPIEDNYGLDELTIMGGEAYNDSPLDKIGFCDTIDLLASVDYTLITSINVKGYNSANDGGGGIFNYNSTIDKSTANGGTIIDPSVSLALQGTGVGLGCWVRQSSEVVNVKWFGAVGDGATDDTVSIQNALDFGTSIFFDNYTFVITSSLIISKDIDIKMSTGTIIDGTAIPNATVVGESDIFIVSGNTGASSPLTATTTTGSSDYTLASVSGLSKDDYVLITSDAYHSIGVTGGNNKQGWITQISGIVGNVISTYSKAYADMTVADTAILTKVNLLDVNISGGSILGGGIGASNGGIRIAYCKNSIISNVRIVDCEDIGISMAYSVNSHIKNMEISGSTSGGLGTTGYGVVFVHASEGCSLKDSRITNCRHSVSGGGIRPTRHILIDNNTTVGCGINTADLDCHEPCYYWNITNNSITPSDDSYGGIIIRGKYILAQGNKIYGSDSTDYGFLVNVYYTDTEPQKGIRILDNYVHKVSYGALLGISAYDTDLEDIIISGNQFKEFNDFAITNQKDIANLTISNNNIGTSTISAKCLELTSVIESSNFLICNNQMNIREAQCLDITNIDKITISENILKNEGAFNCIDVRGGYNININGNNYSGDGTFVNAESILGDQESLSVLGNTATITATGAEDFIRVSGVGKRVNIINNICSGVFRYGAFSSDRDKVIISTNIFEGNTNIPSTITGAVTSVLVNNIED